MSKRLIGYVNWHRGRKIVHRREVLDALMGDLKARAPSHIAVTGDLVNIGLKEEFVRAAEWLHDLGAADHVSVVPGNHDAYVRVRIEHGTAQWRPYMASNAAGAAFEPMPETGFPYLRLFGRVALIGLSSAIPTAPFVAAGHLGRPQRRLLSALLERLGAERIFRVVMIHHPPLPGQTDWRRGLRDDRKLKRLLRHYGCELVLHGHLHEATVQSLETSGGPAPVIGVPSASAAIEGTRKPLGRYNLYEIEAAGDGWRCEMVGRAVGADGGVREIERRILRSR
jgi:3',5'-cyclic AMP phosphodiesterase CpdA